MGIGEKGLARMRESVLRCQWKLEILDAHYLANPLHAAVHSNSSHCVCPDTRSSQKIATVPRTLIIFLPYLSGAILCDRWLVGRRKPDYSSWIPVTALYRCSSEPAPLARHFSQTYFRPVGENHEEIMCVVCVCPLLSSPPSSSIPVTAFSSCVTTSLPRFRFALFLQTHLEPNRVLEIRVALEALATCWDRIAVDIS